MKLRTRTALYCCIFFWAATAHAHRLDELLQATLFTIGNGEVVGSVRLIPGIQVAPAIIAGIDTDGDGRFSETEKRLYALHYLQDLSLRMDGFHVQPVLQSVEMPQPHALRDGLGEIHVVYSFPLDKVLGSNRVLTLESRHFVSQSVFLVNVVVQDSPAIEVLGQKRNQTQSDYELDFRTLADAQSAEASKKPALSRQLWNIQSGILFRLGMQHIAEGFDHLLFLLTLLLVAPSVMVAGRWRTRANPAHTIRHIAGIVTAFTLGHSITLMLSALHLLHLPARTVEKLIAASILVSALHVLRPLFPVAKPGLPACSASCMALRSLPPCRIWALEAGSA